MALDLTSQSAKEFILERTQEAVKYDNKQAAQEVLKIFREELPNQQDQVAAVPGLYDIYKHAWISSQFICLSSIAEDDFFDLMKENLVDGLRLEEYDIIDKIGLRISFIPLESEQIAFMEQLLEVIKKNAGVLGTQNLKLGGRTVLPTIQNWLADYDTYPSQSAQRWDFEQISYLSKSPNATTLSESDKKVLLDILDCYDSLRNLLAYYRSLPEAKDESLTQEELVRFYPGAILVDSIEEEDGQAAISPAQMKPPQSSTASSGLISEQASSSTEPQSPTRASTIIEDTLKPVSTPARRTESRPQAAAPRPQGNYIVDETPTPAAKPAQTNEVAEEIKKNLRSMNIQATRAPLNVQDFLNERHNKGNTRAGIVFDSSAEPAAPAPAPKPVTPPANLPIAPLPEAAPEKAPNAKTETEEDKIAKKLEELRKRKQS